MQLARKLILAGTTILILSGVLLMMSYSHGQAYQTTATGGQTFDEVSVEIPPAQLEPCLHCHIQGEHKNLWTPTLRWLTFGSFSLVFLFGFYQSTFVWTQRKPFKPLTTRFAEWVENVTRSPSR